MRIVGQITEAQQEEPAAKGQRDEQPQRAIQKNRGDRFGAPGGMGVRRVNRARKVAAAGAKQKRIEKLADEKAAERAAERGGQAHGPQEQMPAHHAGKQRQKRQRQSCSQPAGRILHPRELLAHIVEADGAQQNRQQGQADGPTRKLAQNGMAGGHVRVASWLALGFRMRRVGLGYRRRYPREFGAGGFAAASQRAGGCARCRRPGGRGWAGTARGPFPRAGGGRKFRKAR